MHGLKFLAEVDNCKCLLTWLLTMQAASQFADAAKANLVNTAAYRLRRFSQSFFFLLISCYNEINYGRNHIRWRTQTHNRLHGWVFLQHRPLLISNRATCNRAKLAVPVKDNKVIANNIRYLVSGQIIVQREAAPRSRWALLTIHEVNAILQGAEMRIPKGFAAMWRIFLVSIVPSSYSALVASGWYTRWICRVSLPWKGGRTDISYWLKRWNRQLQRQNWSSLYFFEVRSMDTNEDRYIDK